MSDLVEQIDALLTLNAKGAVSHPVPGLAVDLLERAKAELSLRQSHSTGVVVKTAASCPTCHGTGDHCGNPDFGQCDDCGGTGILQSLDLSDFPPKEAEVTDSDLLAAEQQVRDMRVGLERIAAIRYPAADTHYALKATIDRARDQARLLLKEGG